MYPGAEGFADRFKLAEGAGWKELAQKLYITNTWGEYFDMYSGVIAEDSDGSTATMGPTPKGSERDLAKWYVGTEPIPGVQPYVNHLTNKKWPLRKVLSGPSPSPKSEVPIGLLILGLILP